jgi:hypothetical protein
LAWFIFWGSGSGLSFVSLSALVCARTVSLRHRQAGSLVVDRFMRHAQETRHTSNGLGILIVSVCTSVFWPTGIATIGCADGSSLTIREASFGTNHHTLSSPRWQPSLRNSL